MKFFKKIPAIPRKLFTWFRKLSWKKKLLVSIVLIILFFVIMGQIAALTAPPKYTLAKAERHDITETVTETGNISTNGNTQIFSPTNGVVTEIYVSNGTRVTKGQNLLTIQSTATQQEQQAAYANYLSAVASLNAAQANLNVLRADMYTNWEQFRNLATNDTYEDGNNNPDEQNRAAAEFQISQDMWLAAEKKFKDQQTVVGQASAQVSSNWLLYQATQNAIVQATRNGVITNLMVQSGATVQAPTAMGTTQPILNITNLTTTEVIIALSESDIVKIKEGQEVTIDVNAVNDKTYQGVVNRMDTVGTNNQGVIRYNAYIEISDPDESLRPGMTTDAEIITNKISNVLSVPNAAIKPYQGGRAVRIVNPEKEEIKYIPVKIGVRGKDRTQILHGIEEGQEVVTALSNEQISRPGLF